MSSQPDTTPDNPSSYKGVRLDADSIRILRSLGQGNLSKGIRTAAQLTVDPSKTPLDPYALDLALKISRVENVPVVEVINRALTAYEASITDGADIPKFYKGTYHLKTRHTLRDSKIVHMILEGIPRQQVAAKFNLSVPRVHQIYAAYREANKHDPEAFKAWRPKPTSRNQMLLEKGMQELAEYNAKNSPPEPIKDTPPEPANTNNIEGLPFSDEDLDDLFGAD